MFARMKAVEEIVEAKATQKKKKKRNSWMHAVFGRKEQNEIVWSRFLVLFE